MSNHCYKQVLDWRQNLMQKGVFIVQISCQTLNEVVQEAIDLGTKLTMIRCLHHASNIVHAKICHIHHYVFNLLFLYLDKWQNPVWKKKTKFMIISKPTMSLFGLPYFLVYAKQLMQINMVLCKFITSY
jgi:hypothetical protein